MDVAVAVCRKRAWCAVRRKMFANMFVARMLALVALAGTVTARAKLADARIYVDVAPESEELGEIEKRYTKELMKELKSASDDALLLFSEYASRSGGDLKIFLKNISMLNSDTKNSMDRSLLDNAPSSCRAQFERRLRKIEFDAHRAASFNAENHHKFLLAHMIVLRMHLNKSEDYIKKCANIVQGCGIPCETTPKVTRWRRLALEEINRVRDDILHSRRSYRDLVLHGRRRHNHIRRQATARADAAVTELAECAKSGGTQNKDEDII
ncbi:PREDICTED: uncharacterized protein LOC106117202 [Papilio xuthus]|nr:PREDICTED: uncharacterized protein LOC106117202 [Papilio xuthus]